MIWQLYSIFFFITLIFIFIGYFSDADVLKIIGYGLVFILGVMLFQPTFFGNVEICETLSNHTHKDYVYSDNFSDSFHWDAESPPPNNDGAVIFHIHETNEYIEVCQEIQNRTIGFWITLLGLIGFIIVFYERRNQDIKSNLGGKQ